MDNSKVIERWHSMPINAEDIFETQLLMSAKKFKRYKYSIYLMHKCALKLQHWFFKL